MAEHKNCVVCGLGSNREKWNLVSGDFVACDHHTQKEFQDAIKAAKALPVKPPEPQAPPPANQAK
jgi:hypothetical protein